MLNSPTMPMIPTKKRRTTRNITLDWPAIAVVGSCAVCCPPWRRQCGGANRRSDPISAGFEPWARISAATVGRGTMDPSRPWRCFFPTRKGQRHFIRAHILISNLLPQQILNIHRLARCPCIYSRWAGNFLSHLSNRTLELGLRGCCPCPKKIRSVALAWKCPCSLEKKEEPSELGLFLHIQFKEPTGHFGADSRMPGEKCALTKLGGMLWTWL